MGQMLAEVRRADGSVPGRDEVLAAFPTARLADEEPGFGARGVDHVALGMWWVDVPARRAAFDRTLEPFEVKAGDLTARVW